MKSLLLAARYFSCSCLTTEFASVVPLPGTEPNWESSIDTNLSDEAVDNPLQDFHHLFCQLETTGKTVHAHAKTTHTEVMCLIWFRTLVWWPH